ncbi:MAG: CoA-binding protein [Phycisphaerales bacterium]|nr:CoA-binding protein [Phycisphaerales bacterium]
MKKTLVVGASASADRYSYKAVKALLAKNYPVLAFGSKPGTIGDIAINTNKEQYTDIDTVTLYINPEIQKNYYDYILSIKPKRLIFNPGTENKYFFNKAKEVGINCVEACTLVLLSTGQY